MAGARAHYESPIPQPNTPREHRSLNWIGLAWHGDSSQNYIYTYIIYIHNTSSPRAYTTGTCNSNIGKRRGRLRRHRIRRPSTGEYHRCSSLFMGQVTPWRYSWTGNELGNVHRRLPNARTLSSRDPLLRHPPPPLRPASTLPLSLSLRLCAWRECIRAQSAVRGRYPRRASKWTPPPSPPTGSTGWMEEETNGEYRAGEKVSGNRFLRAGVVSLIGDVYSVLVRSLASCRD